MFGPDRCPKIKLSPEDRELYDKAARKFLQDTMSERAKFNAMNIESQHWAFVKRRKEVSVFSSVPGSTNKSTTIMVGTGLIDGRLEDVMEGLYCDRTDDLRTALVLTGYNVKDGSKLIVHERCTPEDPFRCAGIKWFAGRCAWGLQHRRDVLIYERMGTTTDALGNELTYHTLQSIKRPEWPSESTPGMQRQHTASCYLYILLCACTNKTEIFLWGSILKFGWAPEKAMQLGIASTWLNVVRSPRGGRAKKFSALMDEADSHQWMPFSTNCHGCYRRKPKLGSYALCSGCHQSVCEDCSEQHYIFELGKSGKAKEQWFCALCVKNVTGDIHLGPGLSSSGLGYYDASVCSTVSMGMSSSGRSSRSDSFLSRTFSFKRPMDPFRPRVSPSGDKAPGELTSIGRSPGGTCVPRQRRA
ncbi:hypothetical protein PHYSODRAFT_496384 [Phytophthora sojae]|uniref:FYVE-type domain-containing protein n=1 Tax=Phytophthora sojae (strain P6497) TaxID=1094619 RepID=G4Z4Q0_PHYSP|nr:hypothetical protein PHYSODRAFT_496384 [Phytophthora sojae]EGZ21587.1 hypothetical protein PHYSODRAFT_496384 [Phytophthora sojae]|eukprot:XP_009524304.1 hypothetical protein PHYSODRAFT_496384 [Phytophthora sojae]